jgi:hypothetical protein
MIELLFFPDRSKEEECRVIENVFRRSFMSDLLFARPREIDDRLRPAQHRQQTQQQLPGDLPGLR